MKTATLVTQFKLPWLAAIVVLTCLSAPLSAHAQYYLVDCSGTNWWAYPSINSALVYAWPGTNIVVTGTCNENVTISGKINIWLGAYWGQTARINGNLNIVDSDFIHLYGLAITNQNGDGVDVSNSRITLDTCSASGNLSDGILVGSSSYVEIDASGSFNDNGSSGVHVVNHSFVNLVPWAGAVEIRRNKQSGIWASQADVATGGNTLISDSVNGPGIDFRGAVRGQFGNWAGANVIENNPNGGVSLQENAEISFWSLQGSPASVIRNNGQFGIAAGFGSQVTLAGAQVNDNAGAGVDVYAHSQFYANSSFSGLLGNQILRNGTATDPLSAGIRVDGNSEALLRGGDVGQNNGPALLALVNSSADFSNVNFAGNAGGVISCDSTSTMASDLDSNPASGVQCKAAHAFHNRQVRQNTPTVPDISRPKKAREEYHQATSGKAFNDPR